MFPMVFPLVAALLATAPGPTLVVLDGWVLASVVEGKWSAPDRARICSAPWQLYSVVGPAEITLRGLMDLDGDGRIELVLEDRDPWGIAVEVWRFDRGKLSSLAKVGTGE